MSENNGGAIRDVDALAWLENIEKQVRQSEKERSQESHTGERRTIGDFLWQRK
jgi:hypothetical protein